MNLILFKFLVFIKKCVLKVWAGVTWIVEEIMKALIKILIAILVLIAIYFFFLREFLNLSLFL